MKKGLSLLLSLLLVISVFSCLGVVASAADYTVYANTWYTVASGDHCYFTAPVYGEYRFYSDGYGDPKITIYDSYGYQITSSDDINDRDFDTTLTLYAGETVELSLYNYSGDDYGNKEQCRFQITYQEIQFTYVYLDTWYTVADDSYVYFTAPTDGNYSFASSGYGDPKIRVYDMDGYKIGEDDDSGPNLDFYEELYLYAGQTVELNIYNLDDISDINFIIQKVKAITSVQYFGEPIYVEENYDGWWETDEYNNRYFCYDIYSGMFRQEGSYLYVTYDNGETDSFIYDSDYAEFVNIKGDFLEWENYYTNQDEQHWYRGGNNYITLELDKGAVCYIPVTIVTGDSSIKPVQSISYSFGPNPIQVIYGIDGTWSEDEYDNRYFRYYVNSISQPGSVLTIRYTDGTSDTYTYYYEKGFRNANNERLPGYIDYTHNQYQVHWGMGTNYITVSYNGATCQVPVQVIDNPYSTVEFIYGDNTLYHNADDYAGYWSTDNNGNEYFRYYTNVYNEGNAIKVYYRDGNFSIFYYNEYHDEFMDVYGNIYTHAFESTTTQTDNHWYLGGTYPVNFTIAGINTTSYLTIVENPVASFVLNPVYPVTYYEGSNCRTEYDVNNNAYYQYVTPGSRELMYRDGTTFTVYYKNGTSNVYRYSSRTESFTDANGNGFEGSLYWYTNQYENHWYVGTNYITVEYMGVKGNIPVQVLPANQTPGRWLNYDEDYDEWFCMLGTYTDYRYDGLINYDGTYYYVRSGYVDWYYSGIVAHEGSFYYVNNGVLDWNATGLAKYGDEWYYVTNGTINWGATGFVNAYSQWYYVENGYLNPYKDTLCCLDGVWYGVDDGKINWAGSRLVNYGGAWYYVENGSVNWGYNGLAQMGNDWYYVTNGMLDWGYTGLVNYGGIWFYVINGYLDWNATGIVYYGDTFYYVENGSINWYCDTLAQYNGEWYYVYGGTIAFGYTGLVNYNGTFYYVENGYLNWYSNTLVNYNGDWYYAYNGEIAWWYTGLVNYNGTFYYVENGCLNWYSNTLVNYNGDWYYAYNGEIAWWYTGLVNYNGTFYYVENGCVNWGCNTLVQYNGDWYYVYGGSIAWNYTGYVYYNGTNYYITNGYLNWAYN